MGNTINDSDLLPVDELHFAAKQPVGWAKCVSAVPTNRTQSLMMVSRLRKSDGGRRFAVTLTLRSLNPRQNGAFG
jgi:hypothetical protein